MPATDLAHPTENRPLAIEEYMRLQEFPDEWIVCGSMAQQYKQLGNAVPVGLGAAIGHRLVSDRSGTESPYLSGFKYSRYRNTSDITWGLSQKKSDKLAQRNRARQSLRLF
jgi:DNA (cytosine-5)-methyltransferase 1